MWFPLSLISTIGLISRETPLLVLGLYISLYHPLRNDLLFANIKRKGAAGNQIKFWFPAEKTDVKCLEFL